MFKNSAPIKKFCKVCQDAGKSETEYRSHFTRETVDPNSTVVCPTLLAQECRYCYKKGHTVKYCKVLKEKEREKEKEPRILKKNVNKEQKKPANQFECLYEDESNTFNPMSNHVLKEEFPTLTNATLQKPVANSYAAAAAKPAAPKPIPVTAPEPNLLSNYVKRKSTLNWAACESDSDSEEDEIQNYPSFTKSEYNDAW